MIKHLLAIAACAAVLTVNARSQEMGWDDCVKVDNVQLITVKAFGQDFASRDFSNDSLLVGQENFNFHTATDASTFDIRKTLGAPDDTSAKVTLTDMYERVWNETDIDLYSFFNKSLFAKNSTATYNYNFSLSRGGVYAYSLSIGALDYQQSDTATVYGSMGVNIGGRTVISTGEDLDITAYYNTGYPYDMSSLTGNEQAKVTVYKLDDERQSEEIYTHQVPLNLKDENYPLLAGIDSLNLKFEKPELGAYFIRFESNWSAVENREIILSVEDTLRAAVNLDKQTYILETDRSARLHFTMDYRYPHVSIVEPDTSPTIRLSAALLRNTQEPDTLFRDSLKIADDSFQTKDLLYDGEWELDLTKIDTSKLNDDSAEYLLNVTITFNGMQQYATAIPVSIIPQDSGINHVNADNSDDKATYILNGIRVAPQHRLPPGIYIRNGKKIIIK